MNPNLFLQDEEEPYCLFQYPQTLSVAHFTNLNLFLQEYSIPSIQAISLFFNSIFFQFKIQVFVSCSLYYWIPQIFKIFWKIRFELIFVCVCVCMVNDTDSEEFMLLSQVKMGHKRTFAFAMKARSEICGSLGRTLATLRYRESEGEKKPCATLEILTAGHRHPLLSFLGLFFSLYVFLLFWFGFETFLWFRDKFPLFPWICGIF